MKIIQDIIRKIVFPNLKSNRYESLHEPDTDNPTERELRYKTLKTVINTIASDLNFDQVAQKVVNVMVNDMDYPGGILFIVDEKREVLVPWTTSETQLIQKILTWLPKPFREHNYPLTLHDNPLVQAYKSKEFVERSNLSDFISPIVDEGLVNRIVQLVGIQSTFAIPVFFKSTVRGVLMFNSLKSETTELEREMLETFADQVGIAMYNSELFSQVKSQVGQLEQQNQDLEALYNLTSSVGQSLEVQKVIQAAVNALPQDAAMIGASISFVEDKKLIPQVVSENELSEKAIQLIGELEKYQLDLSDPKFENLVSKRVIDTGKPIFTEDFGDVFGSVMPEAMVNSLMSIIKVKSLAIYPLRSRRGVAGIIIFYLTESRKDEITENKKQLLQTYALQISIAMENANLYENSQTIQANLKQALAELKEARRRERDMMDVMGHELRTPISIVRNALSMLEREGQRTGGNIDPAMLTKYIDMGLESSRREIKLIETLLSATKVESARLQLYLSRVDVKDVINDAMEGYLARMEKKDLSIIYEPPPNDIIVYCDRTRIQEIVDNFLSNAVKYTLEGDVKIKIWQDHDWGYFSIEDTGIGVAAEDMENLGKKFFRAKQYISGDDDTNIVRPGGTGLGLYVTFELIKVMSGKLWINSEVGKGTKFTFTMPTYHNEQDKQFDQTFDKDNNVDRKHIIINGEEPMPPEHHG